MAKQRRTLDGRQRLAPLIAKLSGRGIRLKDELGFFVATGLGLAGSAFGLVLVSSAVLMWFAPETASAVFVCRGWPFPSMLVGSICLGFGLMLVILSRQIPYTILVADHGLVLGYRSGRERIIPWHGIDSCLVLFSGVHLLRLKGGSIVPIHHEHWPAWHDIRLLIAFRQWMGPLVSADAPNLSSAFEKFKLMLVGPGAEVPVERGFHQWQLEKAIFIYSIALLAGLGLAFAGWLGNDGVLLGFAPLGAGVLFHLVLRRPVIADDHVSVHKTGLNVAGRHVGETAIAYVDTKHWAAGPSELSISFMDKRPAIQITVRHDDANMLIEAARIASQFPPLGAVVAGRPMAAAA